MAEADRLELDSLPLTILPDVWIALSGEATEAIRGNEADDRPGNEKAIVKWVTDLTADLARDHTKEKQPELDRLKKWIDDSDVLAITVSGAELNPRYRGHRLLDRIEVCKALIHWSLAFCASDMSDGPWEHIPVSAPTPRSLSPSNTRPLVVRP